MCRSIISAVECSLEKGKGTIRKTIRISLEVCQCWESCSWDACENPKRTHVEVGKAVLLKTKFAKSNQVVGTKL